ncbi:hypothetical protein Tco_0565782 [Tanacetum coccineum]
MKDSSTNPKIQAFRRELEEIALKHLGTVHEYYNYLVLLQLILGRQTLILVGLEHVIHLCKSSESFTSLRQEFLRRHLMMGSFHYLKGTPKRIDEALQDGQLGSSHAQKNCYSSKLKTTAITHMGKDQVAFDQKDEDAFDVDVVGDYGGSNLDRKSTQRHWNGIVKGGVPSSNKWWMGSIPGCNIDSALTRVYPLRLKKVGRVFEKETGILVLSDSDEEEPESQGLGFSEEVDTGAKQVNTAEDKSSSSHENGQKRRKMLLWISEEIEETPKKSKEQILQEEASLAEAIRLDTLQKEEVAKQVHLDSLLAQRIAEEEELNEQQKKRRAQVQFEAQHYTDEDWDLIRAKIEANAELSKSMLGSDLQGEDFAKKMVDLVNQRKKYFAEERARAKRNKPMTQSQLKTYMMNYLKNQGTWKLSQLKNLSFEEVKEEFDKLVKQVESFAPINFEATKASLKRFGEELQTKTTKRLKDDEVKDVEPTKKSGKRRKQMARKGLHTDLDKDDSEDSDEVSEQDDSVSGTKIPINPVPVAMKSPSIATYKIIKQGEKGVYQIVREDGTDIVYINFGAMLKDISRDDLTELYRIVMNRYGMDGPEDELEKVLWKYLKNMFEEPLSTDLVWSLLGQQRIISWRYYDSCRVHCLNLESMDIYMLIERKYPLSAEICKAMLARRNYNGGKADENCYKLVKHDEKKLV